MNDRKAKIREYKEMRHPVGVYRILNKVNGKSFVGSSVNIPAMLNRCRAQLGFGSHPNRILQQEWREYGPEAFEFEALETLDPSDDTAYDPAADLRVLEELWLEKLSPFGDRGYNKPPKGGG